MMTLLYLAMIHFVGDFLLQNNWMALNKSKKLEALTVHCLIYSACFLFLGWRFAITTFWLHFITDFFTSRITSKFWFMPEAPLTTKLLHKNFGDNISSSYVVVDVDWGKRHWFFVMIGADQLIHLACLVYTWQLLIGK
jgi:hypothetical protein